MTFFERLSADILNFFALIETITVSSIEKKHAEKQQQAYCTARIISLLQLWIIFWLLALQIILCVFWVLMFLYEFGHFEHMMWGLIMCSKCLHSSANTGTKKPVTPLINCAVTPSNNRLIKPRPLQWGSVSSNPNKKHQSPQKNKRLFSELTTNK